MSGDCHEGLNVDGTQLKSYRPVSNLPFLAKLLKRVVQTQLQSYLIAHDAIHLSIDVKKRSRKFKKKR